MADKSVFTVVTVDDGTGPVKAVRNVNGQIMTSDQVLKIRTKQQADLTKVAAVNDALIAGDAETTNMIIGQTRDELFRKLAALENQKSALQVTLSKLQAGDPEATQAVVQEMVRRLRGRVMDMTTARDRSDDLLSQMGVALPVSVEPAPVEVKSVAPANG